MNTSSVFLIAGIIIVAVGVAWIATGGPALPSAPAAAQTPVPATTAAAVTTVPVAATTIPPTATVTMAPTATTAPPAVTPTAVSGDDVRYHFLDIAYTGTNRLELLDQYSARSRIIVSALSASDEDIAVIEKTAKAFNSASTTVKLSENVKETDQGDILIKFIPEEGLNAIDLTTAPDVGTFSDTLTRKELYQGNVMGAKILRGAIYINANLRGDARKHVIARSLMYQMGLTGETTKYPESLFYAEENTNVNFAPIDTRAIAMLYNSGFTNGMGAEDLRQFLYTP